MTSCAVFIRKMVIEAEAAIRKRISGWNDGIIRGVIFKKLEPEI
jgi:hypothetical protein